MGEWSTGVLERLRGAFSGPEWESAVAAARQENEWFTPHQVARAVAALREEMLAPQQLGEWLSAYRKPAGWQPGRVGIVMAGNLPLVGFADLAAVVAVGHEAVVKLSSKDRALTGYVVRQLQRGGCPVRMTDELRPEGLDGVIATGGDGAREHFARRFAGVPALLRGSRQSVAVLAGNEDDETLKGLAEDMFLYWGLGCRSVTRLFVPEGYDVRCLAEKLSTLSPLETDEGRRYAECYRYARAMAAMSGGRWADGGFFVLRQVEPDAPPAVPKLAEAWWSEYRSADEVAQWLAGYEKKLQCAAGAVPEGFPRRVALGMTQRPGWNDYADGADTVEFLLRL